MFAWPDPTRLDLSAVLGIRTLWKYAGGGGVNGGGGRGGGGGGWWWWR